MGRSNVPGPGGVEGAWPPIRRWLPGYDWEASLPYDVAAGVTVGVMAVPQSLSYALIAGLPPVFGLYSDLQICYPIFGTSRFLVVGPVAVMSLMSRVAMEKLELVEGSTEWINNVCFLSVLVGIVQLILYMLNMGSRLSELLPECAISGFSSAAALLISGTQITSLLGVPKCQDAGGQTCSFAATIWHAVTSVPESRAPSLICSMISVLVLLGFRRLRYLSTPNRHLLVKLLPKLGALTVVAGCIGVVAFMWDSEHGAPPGLAVVGYIPTGLPSPRWVPQFPASLSTLLSLLLSSLPIALVGFAEATAIGKASAKLQPSAQHVLCENDELLALASCNLFTSWVGGFPVTGSFSRTAINAESGAKSTLSTAIAAVTVILVLLFLTSYLALLPKPAVSAIVLSAVLRLVDVNEFKHLLRQYQLDHQNKDVFTYLAVFMGALLISVEAGLLLGLFVHRVSAVQKQRSVV